MQKQRLILGFVALLTIAALFVMVRFPTRLGLDLQGGAQLLIQVKPSEDITQVGERELEAVKAVLENRVNGLGVSEPIIQTVGRDQISVQLPGVSDPQQAERVLGGTAQLEFRKQRLGTEAQLQAEFAVRQGLLAQQEQLRASGDEAAIAANQAALERSNEAIQVLFEPAQPTPLTGKYLRDAGPQPTPTGGWEVVLRFNAKGGEIFADLTKEIAGTGRTLGVFLDDVLLTAPVVGPEFAETGITGGSAVITGNFDAERANELGIQLRGGALPLPVEVVENRTVGATLGRDSVQSSIYAGVGGLILVLIFMVAYYRLPGAIADLALVLYALFTFAAFKLLGVTLTLPGIAGFILSIGMAVDANVLIFERTREELRAGKTLYRSVESGFYRAFSSILDSNVTTLIACAALFWLGSGLVRGFALTLALGVGVSMFTALTCSRTFLLTAISIPELRKPDLFCPNLPKS
ncbi:protein translocase subunit SecD [Trichothermofontia sp.]